MFVFGALIFLILFVSMHSLLVWNNNGTASKRFQRTLKDLLARHKASVLGLLEPKVSGAHADIICNGLGYIDG